MATATTLPHAAGQAFDNLFALWAAGNNQLKNALAGFSALVLPIFPDAEPVGRPVGNWAILMSSLAFQMPPFSTPQRVPYEQLVAAANYVYKTCWLAARATPSAPAVTNAQQTALLAAYNASF